MIDGLIAGWRRRGRTTLVGLALALLVAGGSALPAAAAPRSIAFKMTATDVTTFVECPAGTPKTFSSVASARAPARVTCWAR